MGTMIPNNLLRTINEILNFITEGVISVDEKGIILIFNPEAQRIFDIQQKSAVGKKIHDVLPTSCLRKIIRTGESFRNYRYQYENITLHSNSFPIIESNKIVGATSIFRDITEIETVTQELQNTQQLYSHLQSKLLSADEMVIESKEMKQVIDIITRIAGTDTTVLLQGETGVGKGLVAKTIHLHSNRKARPYIEINCAALNESLLESEIFGYEKGSFTGAKVQGKPGLLEIANGGTVFLDEIGEFPLNLQAKLLHAIDEKKVMRVGGVKSKLLDIRIISATNKSLSDMVRQGKFREDLFYRLNVIPILIPPLRERKNDIKALVNKFLEIHNKEYNLSKQFSAGIMSFFLSYNWPGNIREVKNLIQRLVLLSDDNTIQTKHLPISYTDCSDSAQEIEFENDHSLKVLMSSKERDILKKALNDHGNLAKAAEVLQVDKSTIFRKAKRYKLI